MQPSLIEDMLSCGNWVKDMIACNAFLKQVLLLGIPKNAERKIPKAYRHKVKLYDVEEMQDLLFSGHSIPVEDPVYISIDKDVLDARSAVTNWDQGTLSLDDLQKALYAFLTEKKVIGIDICGEYSMIQDLFDEKRGAMIDNRANASLLAVIKESGIGESSAL